MLYHNDHKILYKTRILEYDFLLQYNIVHIYMYMITWYLEYFHLSRNHSILYATLKIYWMNKYYFLETLECDLKKHVINKRSILHNAHLSNFADTQIWDSQV